MTVSMESIEQVRQFNRFYTRVLGLLNNKLLESNYSLAEARILFELAHKPSQAAKDLADQLHLDPAYLSRILKSLDKLGIIIKKQCMEDSRRYVISLTTFGEIEFNRLQEMSNFQIQSTLADISEEECCELLEAMGKIERIIDRKSDNTNALTIRSHRPGDIGYITYRHAKFYSQAYGFDTTFDAYVASGLSQFISEFDPSKEHLWVAEDNSKIVGSIAIVKNQENTAQLRWLLVEQDSRQNGLGRKLVHEAIQFCKRKNYTKIVLWTISNLHHARHLYTRVGFQKTDSKTHHIWGHNLTEELWELTIR